MIEFILGFIIGCYLAIGVEIGIVVVKRDTNAFNQKDIIIFSFLWIIVAIIIGVARMMGVDPK